jgi:manganese oxidase
MHPHHHHQLGRAVGLGTACSFGAGLLLLGLHGGAHRGSQAIHPLLHWLRDATLAAPAAIGAVLCAAAVAQRIAERRGLTGCETRWAGRSLWAVATALPLTLGLLPAAIAHERGLHGEHTAALGEVLVAQVPYAMITGAVLLLALLAFSGARGAPWEPAPSPRTARRARVRVAFARRPLTVGLAALVVAPLLVAAPLPASAPASAAPPEPCGPANYQRSYDVAAIGVHIPYNRWGDGNAHGQVYALSGDKAAIQGWSLPLGETPAEDPAGAGNRRLRPRPLVLRANEGECVKIDFENELPDDPGANTGLPARPRAGITVRGIPYDVHRDDGSASGYNDVSTVPNTAGNNRISYFWKASEEGIHLFSDSATTAGGEADAGSLAHGLYGAFVVEPAGSVWLDPVSGRRLYEETGTQSGELYIDAIIAPPAAPAFRESIQLAQDEMPGTDTGELFGFNYGSEPVANRVEHGCPDCVGEETSLSSWAYGDPALVKLASGPAPWHPPSAEELTEGHTVEQEDCGLGTSGFDSDSCWVGNVTHAYANDPLKLRHGLAGVKETHVFHLHAHQWPAQEGKPAGGSVPVDSQTVGPMEAFTADLIGGAGSTAGTIGDSIFHCHLYPHFAEGFWSLLRVHDVLEDGTERTPDGIRVRAVQPLPDRPPPPVPTEDNPGFPRFIPGEVGWRAPQPPMGVYDAAGEPAPRRVGTRVLKDDPLRRGLPTGPRLRGLDPKLVVERQVMDRMSGGRSRPGAPFNDPCPTGAREVTYDVTAIQLDIVYNEAGWHDTQGRILVLDHEVDDVLAGRKRPEPLFARVNAGDCIQFNVTNRLPNWFGADAFVKLAQTNMYGMHVHLMGFDVLASDGGSNGWNYQQAAFTSAQAAFEASLESDPGACTSAGCRLENPAEWDPSTTSDGIEPGQTLTARWYAGSELRTAFMHDHHFPALVQNRGQFAAMLIEPAGYDFRDPVTGDYHAPIDDPAHGTPCGTACTGAAGGTAMDIVGPGPNDDFREYGLALQDFAPLTLAGGDPRSRDDTIGAPPEPEEFPDEDPGTMAVNYRNAPFSLRASGRNGSPADPAHVFSSYVHGDPATPVLEAYGRDRVRFRVIQGSHEEQHSFSIAGMKWRQDPLDPASPWVSSQAVGVSEAFNIEVPRLSCGSDDDCRGDHLYFSGSVDDLYQGMWGVFRVFGRRVPTLLPLPDNPPAPGDGQDLPPEPSGVPPPPASSAGSPCPRGAPVRTFDIVALDTTITYNEHGDHDPYGLVYALREDVQAIRDGHNPEPLVIRASKGDCLEVTLTNEIDPAWMAHGERGVLDGDAPVATEPDHGTPAGLRVSLQPQMLRYDVRGSDGATVGFNREQTAAPGETVHYRWYADEEVGATNLMSYGDVRGHRHHGLFGGLNIQPSGATYHDPSTGREVRRGVSADIRVPGRPDFREHTVFFSDGLNLRHADGSYVVDHDPAEELDPEDAGEKAFGYRNAPFQHRLAADGSASAGDALARVFSSTVHGDPATDVLRNYAEDPVRLRVLQGADKARQNAISILGHAWRSFPGDPASRLIGVQGGITPSRAFNIELPAAGGPHRVAGDHRYESAVRFHHLSGGRWGLLRAYPSPDPELALRPSALGDVDDPRGGGHPLLPLELDQLHVTAFADLNGNGTLDRGEQRIPGVHVTAVQGSRRTLRSTSDHLGVAELSVSPGSWQLQLEPPPGLTVTPGTTSTMTTTGDNHRAELLLPLEGGVGVVSPDDEPDEPQDMRDPHFGEEGKILPFPDGGRDVLFDAVPHPDGGTVAVGYRRTDLGTDAVVLRMAQDGRLDPSFGEDGIVRIRGRSSSNDAFYGVTVTEAGAILAGGESNRPGDDRLLLARLDPAGDLDTDFGNGGIVTRRVGAGEDIVHAVAAAPDGSVYAVGQSWAGRVDGRNVHDALVTRFDAHGRLDETFGDDGVVLLRSNDHTDAQGLVIGETGGVTVAGVIREPGRDADVLLARWDASGLPDTTFGEDGVVRFDVDGDDRAFGMAEAVDGDGLVVVGSTGIGTRSELLLLSVDDTGTLVPEFGEAGIRRVAAPDPREELQGRGLDVTENGLVAAGWFSGRGDDVAIVRFDALGQPVPDFGDAGIARLDYGGNDRAYAVAAEPGGRTVLVGRTTVDGAVRALIAALRSHLEADLVAEVDISSPARVRDELTVTAQVRNDGPNRAVDPQVRIELAPWTAPRSVEVDRGQCTVAGGAITCAWSSLAASRTRTVTIRLTPTTPGPLKASVHATSGVADPDPQRAAAVTITQVAAAAPLAVGAVSAVAGDRSARVSWQPPTDDGGSMVTGYQARRAPDGPWQTLSAGARSTTFSDLTNGTSYRFDVRAVNANGAGPSTRTTAVRPVPVWITDGIPLSGDWNNDGRSTPGWFHNGTFYLRNANTPGASHVTFKFGRKGDVPVVGDWNGNGRDTVGIRRGRTWMLRNANSAGPASSTFEYGRATDTAVTGDWNGNGRDTIGVRRGTSWLLRNANSAGPASSTFDYGRATDTPVVGDWNRNGTDTIGVHRGRNWLLRNANSAGAASLAFTYGAATDRPMVGDWNANGRDTIGTVRGFTWRLRNSNTAGDPTLTFPY